MAKNCAGVWVLLLCCLNEVISMEDEAQRKLFTLGGGYDTQALLRLAGADANYNVTF
jgi:hypothetical protein